MAPADIVEQLLALPDAESRKLLLQANRSSLDSGVASRLKERADDLLRSDINSSLDAAGVLHLLADSADQPSYRALGLLAQANAHSIGLGDFPQAISLYDEAADTYERIGDQAGRASAQVGKVWALACLGQYVEAMEAGRWSGEILEANGEWSSLATLTMNLAAIHGRQGDDEGALALLGRARDLASEIGTAGEWLIPLTEQNRAIVLRNLGRFEESIVASEQARVMLKNAGQKVEAARAQQNLAVTYYVLGRYNEALELLTRVGEVFSADGRERDAILVQLFISDCLLKLRRFPDVLTVCRQVRDHFSGLGTAFEVAQTLLNEAVAHAGLGRHREALSSIAEASRIFEQEGNEVYAASADLERAAILLRQGDLEGSRVAVEASGIVFRDRDLPVHAAQAYLTGARIAAAQGETDEALQLADKALIVGKSKDIPAITYQCYHLLGGISRERSDGERALGQYDLAVTELERLRGRLMIEFRSGFLEDKYALYEDIVFLCLDLQDPRKGLEYAERAKSRALLDLLEHRLDLSLRAKTARDRPLLDELRGLRAKRDRLWRRWEGEEAVYGARGAERNVQQEVLVLEKRITDLWHEILVRNADYARDALLCHVRTESIQPFLDEDMVVLEYFLARDQYVAFQIYRTGVEAEVLQADVGETQRLLNLLWLNLGAVAKTSPEHVGSLERNARGLLQKLHQLLLAPVQEAVGKSERIIVVPHGPLHYLPFHALHDGDAYLLERHEISYLPGSSIYRFCRESRPVRSGITAFGYSRQGRLPYAVEEAQSIASLMDGEAAVEEEATTAAFHERAGSSRVLHLATHGDFRADNPLFSGLALADGWLTTMDIFNLRLNASLVTLSACQTGRSVVGGGDELLGLMRAFLYAGTSSLALSLWPVADASTAQLMSSFYSKLAEGWTKAAALRHAQLEFVGEGDGHEARYSHPYYWAPFFLVGDPGVL